MNNPKCGTCGAKMKKNGTTKAGTQRWRCTGCGSSSVRKIDNSAKVHLPCNQPGEALHDAETQAGCGNGRRRPGRW